MIYSNDQQPISRLFIGRDHRPDVISFPHSTKEAFNTRISLNIDWKYQTAAYV